MVAAGPSIFFTRSRPTGAVEFIQGETNARLWENANMFQLTESAAKQVREAAHQGGAEGMALRLAARRLPDGTINYLMGFDEVKDEDLSFRSHGVEIVMEPDYLPLLDQATMDFVEMGAGTHQFIFLNPLDPNYVAPG